MDRNIVVRRTWSMIVIMLLPVFLFVCHVWVVDDGGGGEQRTRLFSCR